MRAQFFTALLRILIALYNNKAFKLSPSFAVPSLYCIHYACQKGEKLSKDIAIDFVNKGLAQGLLAEVTFQLLI